MCRTATKRVGSVYVSLHGFSIFPIIPIRTFKVVPKGKVCSNSADMGSSFKDFVWHLKCPFVIEYINSCWREKFSMYPPIKSELWRSRKIYAFPVTPPPLLRETFAAKICLCWLWGGGGLFRKRRGSGRERGRVLARSKPACSSFFYEGSPRIEGNDGLWSFLPD